MSNEYRRPLSPFSFSSSSSVILPGRALRAMARASASVIFAFLASSRPVNSAGVFSCSAMAGLAPNATAPVANTRGGCKRQLAVARHDISPEKNLHSHNETACRTLVTLPGHELQGITWQERQHDDSCLDKDHGEQDQVDPCTMCCSERGKSGIEMKNPACCSLEHNSSALINSDVATPRLWARGKSLWWPEDNRSIGRTTQITKK